MRGTITPGEGGVTGIRFALVAAALLGLLVAQVGGAVGASADQQAASSVVTNAKFKKLKKRVAALEAKPAPSIPTSLPPSGPAGGDLAGSSFPNPVLSPGAVTPGKIGTIPAVRAKFTTAASIPNSTLTLAALGAEDFDTANMHSTSSLTSRLVAPITGIYQVSGRVNWAGVASGMRIADLYRNGSLVGNLVAGPNSGNNAMAQSFASLVRLTAGQYVELVLFQNSGGAVDGGAGEFSMHWVGP